MIFRLTQPWPLDAVIAPAGTVVDASTDDYWALKARGLTPPLSAVPCDREAWEAQLAAYPDHRHLLGGGWQ